MGSTGYLELCRRLVERYAREHLDVTDGETEIKVYIVWYCKTVQNHKALLSTDLKDGMYYEITYNGDKKEIYFDAYKKFENKLIKIEEVEEILKEVEEQ